MPDDPLSETNSFPAHGAPAAHHRITWEGAVATFHCDGDHNSQCHLYPDCEDELWPCEHDLVPHDECWLLPWLVGVDPQDTHEFEGECLVRRDGLITMSWDGDSVLWDYEEAS